MLIQLYYWNKDSVVNIFYYIKIELADIAQYKYNNNKNESDNI